MRAGLAEHGTAMCERGETSTEKVRDEGETPTRLESPVSVEECAFSRDPEPRSGGSLCVELALLAAAAPSVISATVVIASALMPPLSGAAVEPPRP